MTDPRQVPLILFWAPNWLGDVVMSTRLLDLLDQARRSPADSNSAFEILLMVRPAWAPLFHQDPRIDGVLTVERSRGLGGTFDLARLMARKKVSAVILGPPSFRTAMASWLARVPRRIGYRSDGRGFLLTDGRDPKPRGALHYSEEMAELGRTLLESEMRSSFPVPEIPVEMDPLPGCRAISPRGPADGTPFVAIAPGTTYGQAKTWPVEKVSRLVEILTGRGDYRVVFLGDSGAAEFVAELLEGLQTEAGTDLESRLSLIDLTGRTDLKTVVGILKASRGFVGNDSGLMHLSGALGIPTVGVFGSSNPAWTAPLGPLTGVVAAEGFACHPCYLKRCNQAKFCLETIEAEAVLESLETLMARRGAVTGEGA